MKRVLALTLTWLIGTLPATAAVTDQEFTELRAALLALTQRVHALESGNTALRTGSEHVARGKPSSSWADSIKLKGDLRYRYESIHVENRDARDRNRIRARIKVVAKLPRGVEVGFGLASGGDDDPVSTNQTLGGGGSGKNVRLDLAYFNWTASPNINVVAGKFRNIWYRAANNELIWDSDYNPEGFAMTFKNGSFFAQGGLNWLESDTNKSNTRFAYGLQGGFSSNIADNLLTMGIGYYDLDVKGREVFFGDNDDFFGNSFACADPVNLIGCTYLNSFREAQLFAQLETQLGELPLIVFGDYVRNTAADRFDTGWAAGFKLGKAAVRGDWEFAYTFMDREADSVFGLTTASDPAGGGADNDGHILQGAVAISKNWKVGFTYYQLKRNEDLGVEEDYKRLQVDTQLKF
ncbi:MAG: putative porin [Gammaproteobacteria bacterium]|nr:putative porin [Gammaproteobacteria bacterium]